METLDSHTDPSSRRWVWIVVGGIALVAGIPVLFLLLYGGVATLHEWFAPVISLPPLHVRVVDGATGAPISGARVMRAYYREGGAKGFDSSSSEGVAGSVARAVTDAEGNAVLPGTETMDPSGIRGLTGMSWVVFAPGWMPASGCYWEGPMRSGGCSGFGGMVFNDFWYRPKFDRYLDELDLEVRVIAPPAIGAPTVTFDTNGLVTEVPPRLVDDNHNPVQLDPWGEYFRHLNVLVEHRYLTVDDGVREGTSYLQHRPPTRGMLVPLAELAERRRPTSQPEFGADYRTIAGAISDYCEAHPRTDVCGWAIVANIVRDYRTGPK